MRPLVIALLTVLIAQAPASDRGAAPSAQESISLEPGKPVERELSGGGSHSYKITMISGQYLHAVVAQRGIDVAVALLTPDGKKISEVNSEPVVEGSETLSVIAEAPGAYLIEVRSPEKTAGAGRYEIKVEELRAATTEDKYRVAGESVFREADRLDDGTLEDRRKSIEKYHEALELYRRATDRKREAQVLNNIGAVYWSLGEPQKALEKQNEALMLWQAVGDRRGETETLNSIGVNYWSLGDMRKALEKFDEALPLMRAVGNRKGEADTLSNIGMAYWSLGEMQKALEKLNESLPLRWALGDRGGEAVTLNGLGQIYWSLRETQKALEKQNEALSLMRAVGDHKGEAIMLNNIGLIYWSLGEIRKALEKYNEALPLSRAVGDRSTEAVMLSNIGKVYWSLGEPQKALEKFDEALSLMRAVGFRGGEAVTLSSIGEVYRSLGEPQKALEKYNEALPLSRAVGDRGGEAKTLSSIGAVYQSLGEMRKALEKYDEALSLSREVGNRSVEATVMLGIARAEQTRGNLPQARQTAEQAIGLIESIRTNVVSQELRASYFASQQEFFETYIDVLMQMRKQNPAEAFDAAALAVSERARARSLLELLKESRADIRQGVDPALLERERSLQQRLNARAAAQARLLNRKHTPEQAATVAKEIAAITTEYEAVRALIRARSPRYAALTQPQPLSLTEIQQQVLDPDTLLLEYALGRERSYLWVASRNSIHSYELPGREVIEEAARPVIEAFSANRPAAAKTAAEAAAALSHMILAPAAEHLGAKRLLVVADGILQYVPFGALPAPAASGPRSGAHGDRTPLIVRHEIVNLPSASTLALLRREQGGRKPAARRVAVLADPVFDSNDPRLKADVQAQGPGGNHQGAGPTGSQPPLQLQFGLERSAREAGVSLERLGFSRLEAEAIAALTPEGERLKALDFEASRATALSEEMGRYRIVHFATHGLLNSEHPELSGLVLSLVDERGRPQDGFLRSHEVYNLSLKADLVVLSGCRTALGKDVRGEGLVGLTRGFMYAGAPRVVASLWQVPDKATADLMKRFYKGMLADGQRPAAALRAAQVAMWKEKRAPYFWAAFTLQGEWR